MACQGCFASLTSTSRNNVPYLSIASGIDYGYWKRIELSNNLKPLTLLESMLIAKIRLFGAIIKLTGNDRRCIKGHIISFPHDGPDAVAQYNTNENILPNIKGLQVSPFLKVDFDNVTNWLNTLKNIHPQYAGIQIDMSLSMQNNITTNATFDNSEESSHLDQTIGNDTANVRWTSAGGDNESSKDDNAIFNSVLLTDPNGSAFGSKQRVDAMENVLSSFATSINDENQQYLNKQTLVGTSERTIRVVRDKTPINEFRDQADLFYGAFPHLFLFGKGLPKVGHISERHRRHLLLQFHNEQANDHRFIFTLFNQIQRWEAIKSVNARVKNNNESFQKFSEWVKSHEFLNELETAIDNPNSASAKYIFKKIQPHILATGKNVPYGPIQRKNAMSQLYALVFRFGLPSVFFTFAPDDVHNPLAIRLCLPNNDNYSFPAIDKINDEISFMCELRKGAKEIMHINVSEYHLQQLISRNPVATSEVFKTIVETTFAELLRHPLTQNMKKTVSLNDHDGIFGKVSAAYIVIETNTRKSLHAHCAVWGGLPPAFLQKIAAYPDIVNKVSLALDSMFSASLPEDIHIEGALRRALNIPPTRFAYTKPTHFCNRHGDIIPEELESFKSRFFKLQDTLNCHAHSATCRKGTIGMTQCRLARPQPLNENTGPVMIQPQGSDRIITVPVSEQDCNVNYDDLFKSTNDIRPIAWELKRPILKGSFRDYLHLISPDIANRLNEISENKYTIIDNDFKSRNGYIVETNDVLASVLNCNTEACPLGAEEQAKTILFYLLKYLTKDSVELGSTLTVIRDALLYVNSNPSQAEDTNTDPNRFGKYFLQRLQNRITGLVEISDTQAAAYLLGLPASSCTHSFTYCFALSAIQKVSEQYQKYKHTYVELHDIDYDTDPNSGEDDNLSQDNDSDDENDDYINLCKSHNVPRIIQKKNPGKLREHTYGRQTNGTFPFHKDHPLCTTHEQQLLSKHMVPIVAGCKVPTIHRNSNTTDKAKYALFMMTLFSPWNDLGIPSHGINFKAFKQFLNQLDIRQNDENWNLINRSRLQTINNISKNLRVDNRNATVWKTETNTFTGRGNNFYDIESNLPADKQDDLMNDIEAIRDQFAADFNIILEDQRLTYAQDTALKLQTLTNQIEPIQQTRYRTFSQIDNVFLKEMLDEIIHDELQTDEPPLHNPEFDEREIPTMIHLNIEQQQIVKLFIPFFEKRNENPPRILIHGGPGTGKSFVVTNGIIPMARYYKLNTLTCAFTGSAAVNIHGHTIHSLLMLRCTKKTNASTEQYVAPLSTSQLAKLQESMKPIHILIIDEISTVASGMLNAINKRLQQAKQNEQPFGGLCVILIGDFFQMKPTTGRMIYSDVVKFYISKDEINTKNINSAEGANLFKTFQLIELTQQMRAAEDPIHVERINSIRCYDEKAKLTEETLNFIRNSILKSNDYLKNPKWIEGPIIVHDNTERIFINNILGEAFAKQTGVPIIRWKTNFKCPSLPITQWESFYEDNKIELTESFIANAIIYVSENFSTQRKIVNGTKAMMHSLAFSDSISSSQIETMRKAINEAQPGQIVMIPIIPSYIIVKLENANKEQWPKRFHDNNDIIVPIPIELFPTDPLNILYQGKKYKCYVKKHALDLGFSLTYAKTLMLENVLLNTHLDPSLLDYQE
ncbi:DNA helicase PIF1, ATP-dependent domain-containing protein [Rozella allomycis CSF55]|uniref:ATP-dependent DNA helicase n=1 Tax=Rozella allomycis (strain CSF55) TaxID=988480 RepID=A0A075B4K7_ROZAC|nr:DNA helicase PIF1, ATP-dependent domain-containing protein [Rozella allomycis CSF55]|eukprot:EPZ36432.1 DNA helicase PIF1, ATP-dependent domain-containing protein [Rozella allomycis CSF55]